MQLHCLRTWVVGILIAGPTLGAQSMVGTEPRLDLGVAGVATRGTAATGDGTGVGLDVRWHATGLRWLSIASSIEVSRLGEVPIALAIPAVSQFRTSGRTFGGVIGPEVSRRFGVFRPYVQLLAGVSRVTSSPTLSSFGTDYPWESHTAWTPKAELGAGIAVRLTSRLTVDAGVRSMYTRSSIWLVNPVSSFDGRGSLSSLPPLTYTRTLQSVNWRAGVHVASF